jgi:Flp pilus assembly pilin Flp
VLIGLLVVAALTVITAEGGWVNTQWTTVNTLVNP